MEKGKKGRKIFSSFLLWWKEYFKSCADVLRGMGNDNVNILASGLVYSTLVALIPCLTFLFVFLSSFGVLQNFLDLLKEWLGGIFGPENAQSVIGELTHYSNNAMSLGVFGLVSFIITGMFLVNKIDTVINTIFHTKPERGTIKRLLSFLVFLIVFTFLIALSFALSNTLNQRIAAKITNTHVTPTLSTFLKKVASYAVAWLTFFFMLKLVPNARVKIGCASVGSTTGVIALLITNLVFGSLINRMVSYWTIYGTLASMLFILLYFYVLWYIVIIISELTYVRQYKPDKNTLLGRPQTPEKIIGESINALLVICKRYSEGEGKTTMRALTKRMATPQARLQSYLVDFERAGFIISANTQHTSFIPSKPLDQIKLKEVLTVLYGAENISKEEIETLGDALAMDFCSSGLEAFSDLTVENLLERV